MTTKQFAHELRRRIDASGMTVSEVAKRSRVGRAHLQCVLSGRENPTIQWASKVGKILGFTLSIK